MGNGTNGQKQDMTMAGTLAARGSSGWISARPIAHRGLHDAQTGIFENSLSAARAAAERGYAIEVDLHLARDGVPVIFHDNTLDRMTGIAGSVRDRSSTELGQMRLMDSADSIPTLAQLLKTVAGRVPLVLELKGMAGADAGFIAGVARDLADYGGPAAVMSFNHWLLEEARAVAPQLTLGLTAQGDDGLRETHWLIEHKIDADFLSYRVCELDCQFVSEFRASGKPLICWTVTDREQADFAEQHGAQITFEGFLP